MEYLADVFYLVNLCLLNWHHWWILQPLALIETRGIQLQMPCSKLENRQASCVDRQPRQRAVRGGWWRGIKWATSGSLWTLLPVHPLLTLCHHSHFDPCMSTHTFCMHIHTHTHTCTHTDCCSSPKCWSTSRFSISAEFFYISFWS